ncbi:hypothetical protein M427DRAFT_47638 [Gonapodya prolifera JEL478]|uniref:Gelsolin-like domain-containing protein n=1 Tax=Gonapodya prolifera (strain JEL478) TaxID=1344416 RepID=A0A139A3P4_GONPJ|nr:hypothetical protein M427DRAFT_47638 [Gonapodya prolifera JEL478]|eukprot:KXS10993.1 hypothetical protein M427DRAFT_47638 [Gonapodya prolifera JEL478]
MKNVIVREVSLQFESLNGGDVFILDAGMNLYQWNGRQIKGGELCRAIYDERKGLPKVHVYSEDDNDAKPFQDLLGVKDWNSIKVKIAQEGGSDAAVGKSNVDKVFLWVSDATGPLSFSEVARGKISLKDFSSDDLFILDVGPEVFVWIGKASSAQEHKQGLLLQWNIWQVFFGLCTNCTSMGSLAYSPNVNRLSSTNQPPFQFAG